MRDLDIGQGVIVSGDLLRAVTSRSGGPGGQNVNKVESRVTIELSLDDLTLPDESLQRIRAVLGTRISRAGVLRVTSQSERSQLANRTRALARMEDLLSDALEEREVRKPTRVSRTEKRKRRENKKLRSETKRLRSSLD